MIRRKLKSVYRVERVKEMVEKELNRLVSEGTL